MNRGNFDAAIEFMDSRVVWENDPGGPRGATTYVGRDGVRRFWDEFLGHWKDYRFEPLEVITAGDGTVIARVSLRAWTDASDQPLELETSYVWTVQDGKALAVRLYLDHAEALAAGRAGS